MNSLILLSMAFAYCCFFAGIFQFQLKKNKRISIGLAGFLSFVCMALIQTLVHDYVVAMFLAYLYAFVMVETLFDCKTGRLIGYFVHTALTFSIMQEVFGNALELFFYVVDPLNNVLTLLLMGIAFLILYFTWFRKLPGNAFWLPSKYRTLFILIEFLLAAMSTLGLSVVYIYINGDAQRIANLILSLGSLALLLVFYGAIYYMNVTGNQNTQLEGLADYNEQQKSYYEMLLSKEEQTRKFRHDIENDLLEIQYYLEHEDIDKSTDKISQLLKDVNGIKKKIYSVGIDSIDVILNYYLVPVQDKIKIQVNSRIAENINLPVSNTDLTKLMANLIKNAIEATMYLPEKERQIFINVMVGRDNMSFRIENTFDVSRNSLISEGTSKEDKKNHGFGIKKVEEIVERNKGTFSRWEEGEHYISVIKFTI